MYSSKRGPMMRLKRAHDAVKAAHDAVIAAHDALLIPPLTMLLHFMFLLIFIPHICPQYDLF
jgi:hypothetical protein